MFYISPADRTQALKIFGKTEQSLNDDLLLIRNWIQSQPHFPPMKINDTMITNALLRNKFSLENTKYMLDMYFTLKSVITEIFDDINPNLSQKQQHYNTNVLVTLPQLTENLSMVFFFKLTEPNQLLPRLFVQQYINIVEMRKNEGFCLKEISFIDMEHVTFEDVLKMTPSFLAKCMNLYQKAYSMRIEAIYILNCKSFVNHALAFLKKLIKPKIFERIHCDPGTGSIKNVLHKSQIPRDYGGDGLSLAELNEMLKKKFIANKAMFDELDNLRVNEKLRPAPLNNSEVLGFYGSFKQLSVD